MREAIGYCILTGFESYLEAPAKDRSGPVAVIEGGVIYDCSLPAWKRGIRPGDSASRAKMLMPEIRLFPRSSGFSQEAHRVYSEVSRDLPALEPEDRSRFFFKISCAGEIMEVIRNLKERFRGKAFHCTFGVASTKLASKAVCLWSWNGFLSGRYPRIGRWGISFKDSHCTMVFIEPEMERPFLKTLDISYLWKLPPELRSLLKELGLRTIGDVSNVPRDDLSVHLGDWAPWAKEWAFGRDPERVKRVYPEESFVFHKNFDRPVPGLSKEFLKTVVDELFAALADRGVGPREIEVNLEGDFPEYRRTRRFFTPVFSRESLFLAVEDLLKDFTGGEVHSFLVKLFDTLPVRRDPLPLLWAVAPGSRLPMEIELALEGIQKKFGKRALYWGREETEGKALPREVLRYEETMTLWDPVRTRGGINNVQTHP